MALPTEGTTLIKNYIEDINKKLDKSLAEREAAAQSDRERVKSLEKKIDQLVEQRSLAYSGLAAAQRLSLPGVAVGHRGEPSKFSFARMCKLLTKVGSPDDKEYGYEVEVQREMRKRIDDLPVQTKTAISGATDAGGAFLISTEMMTDILPELEATMISPKLGVQRIDGLSGVVNWPLELGTLIASYLDTEAEAVATETVTTFGNLELRPHVMIAPVPLTWGMLSQSAMAIEPWIRQRIGKKIGLREDKSIFLGTSASSEPRGVTNVAGINSMNFSTSGDAGGAVVWSGASSTAASSLRAFIKTLAVANALDGATKLGWATSPDGFFKIFSARDGAGRPIFGEQGGMLGGGPFGLTNALLGYPIFMSQQLDSTTDTAEFLMFGDWAQLVNAHWGTIAFAASGEAGNNFLQLRTTIRAVLAHDVGVFYPKAFTNAANFNLAIA